jgi:glycosyltransferase involved in cell wall biosynthesis
VNVLHVSPTYFAEGSFVGGAERYTLELARASAKAAQVVLVSFGERAQSRQDGALRIELLRRGRWPGIGRLATNPISRRFAQLVRWADVVHCHQVHTLSTDVGILLGHALGKRVYVTDLGGGHRWALSKVLPVLQRADALLLISEYSRSLWAMTPASSRPATLDVIWGGVDIEKFSPGGACKTDETLFVGRLLPHKGVNYLVDAMPDDAPLRVVGRAYDEAFFARLRSRAAGRPIVFETAATDDDLVARYRRALVTVLPSVYESIDGTRSRQPELLGLAVLESMACGTAAIVTRVASLPEIVEDGVTGFIVPPNDAAAIREKVEWLRSNPKRAIEMGLRARQTVLDRFTWPLVAARCLRAYAGG